MRSFAENEDILQKFTEVALKQPCLPKGVHVDCIIIMMETSNGKVINHAINY